MADSATTKELRPPSASFARRYGLAFASVVGALLLDLLFRYFNLPHPFAAFALSAIAATFWYAGTKPGIVAALLSSLIRGFIFEGETSRLSHVLYDLVFLTFAILMIWVRRRKEALEVAIADRTATLRAANEDLRRRKEQLDGLFELSPDAVILTDDDFHVLRVNKEFTRIFGYTAEEVAGQWLPELIMPEELRAEALKNRDRLISGNRVELEAIRQRKDDVRFDVSVVARGISLGFDQVAIYLIYRDITERKKAERELRRSEGYLAEAQKLTHTGSWAWNVRTGVLFWSREIFNIYGYEYQEVGPTWPQFLERVHPEDRPVLEEIFRRAQLDKTDYDAPYRIVLPDGSIKHIYSVAHPILNQAGELVEFVGSSMDVTEQWKARTELEKAFDEIKQRTEALRRSEAYLAEAQRLTHTGSWAVRIPQMENAQGEAGEGPAVLPRFGWNASYWSKEMYRIFGLDPDPTPPSYMEVVGRLHPEDARHYTPVVEEAIRDRTDFETDYRLLLPNGAAKYIHVVGHPVVNASGDVIELVGTAMDVTERKQAEEKIREQEVELRQILDAAPQHLSVLRSDGTHLYINQSSLEFLGLTLEEWQKCDIRELVHPDDAERVVRERKQALSSGSPLKIEARFLRYDREYRWLFLSYKPLRDQLGRITRWVVPAIDIDDRKRSEERLHHENVALREEIVKASMFEEIVGNSPALKTVLSRLSKVAPTDSGVLITGETGTGKELIARAIHRRSQRSSRVFVSVNCAAIPRDLIASELFGHEKGAFTGATQQHLGRFELANGGTMFLDEVGELPAETQIALLRVLQEHEFQRVGGTRSIQADARVIAATNRDLEAAIAEGTFRSDLFYRLNVFPIEVPPLRERREDIHLLVEYFIDRYARKTGKKIRGIERSTLELLRSYAWPGNIRELQNVIERSLIVCETQTFSVDGSWLYRQPLPGKTKRGLGFSENLVAQEKEMIEAALRDSGGRVSGPAGAAARLDMPGSTLESKIRSLRINKNRFKPDHPSTSRI